jgi:Concanavalin A-like lectin/glucanases superfamily
MTTTTTKILFFLFLFVSWLAHGQQKRSINPVPLSTLNANVRVGCSLFTDPANFTTGASFSYNAPTNNNSNLSTANGTSLGCMGSVPNQAWFVITVNTGGNLYFNFTNSNAYDVDAVVWGPLANNDPANACAATQSSPLTCDFDAARPDLYINNAQAGQKYVMLVTNYSNASTIINISQPTGGSVTYNMVNIPNCSLIPTATLSGTSTTINEGTLAQLSLAFTGSAPWNYTLSDGTMGTTSASPINVNVFPTASQTYTVNSVNNQCGTSGASGSVGISVVRNVQLKSCLPLDGDGNDAQALNNGILQNGVIGMYNRFGDANKSLQFDGVDDYINLPTNQLNNNTFAFATWVKLDQVPDINYTEGTILSLGALGDEHALSAVYTNGAASWKFSSNAGTILSTAIVDLGWHLLVGVRTGGQLKLYVDGVLTGSTNVSGAATYGAGLQGRIGSGIANNKFFKGKIDDVKIFNGSLIEPEVLLLQNYTSCLNVYNDTFISVQSVSTSVICTGSPFIVRAFTNNIVPDGQLQFTAELSNATGSFASPTVIGTSTFLPLSVTVPTTISNGNYKIRVRYGGLISVNSFDVFVNNPATYNITGTTVLAENQSTNLNLNFAGTGPWTYTMSNGLSGVATTSPWVVPVNPDQSTTYFLSSVQNVCGVASLNGNSTATVTVNIIKQFVTCFPFNGNSTDTKANNTATVNGPILTENRYGQTNAAYTYNGSSDYIQYSTELLRKREYTMSAWVLANSISGNTQYILSQGEFGTNTFQGIGVNSSGWFFQSYTNNGGYSANSSTSLMANQWVHVTAVRSYQSLKLYINGNLAATTNNSSTIPFKSSDIGRIGANSSTLGNYFNGKIDDVRLYKGALTDDEVFALFANTNDCPTVENAPIIVSRTLSPATVCAGNQISVGYTASNITINAANPLTVQLSDANGFFGSPTNLGTGFTSPISVTIPANSINSTFYRARLVSLSGTPVTSVNSQNVIVAGALPTATISGGGSIAFGGTSSLTVNFTGTAPWTYSLNNGSSQSSSISPISISVSPFGTTSYTVTAVSNSCGAGTTSGITVVNVAPNISLGSFGNTFCQGQIVYVPFTANFAASPSFNVELSDGNESFSSPTVIGTGTASPISTTIPANATLGTSYKIRIVSTSPLYTSPEFAGITINTKPTATISGTATINEGQSTNLTLNFTGTAPWTYAINNGASQITSTSPLTISVAPVVSTTYTITSLSNVCGVGTASGTAIVTVNSVTYLKACYPFTNNSNPSIGINNANTTAAILTSDRNGNNNSAYLFNKNTPNYISYPAIGLTNNKFSISVWIKLSSLPALNEKYYILSIGNSNEQQAIILTNDNINGLHLDFRNNPAGTLSSLNLSGILNTTDWFNIIVTKDIYPKMYLNGNLLGTGNNPSPSFYDSNPFMTVGSMSSSVLGDFFDGKIDDIQIYYGALTPNQATSAFSILDPCTDIVIAPTISLGILSNNYCQNQTLSVPFSSVNISPTAGSPINVELSDINGSFASPIIVGTSTLTSGIISATFPAGTVAGSGYKIRLKQGSIISNLSQALTISYPSTATISGTSTINEGQSTNLTINFTGTAPWTYAINNGASQTTSTNPLVISVSPLVSATFTITSLSNACGGGNTSGSAVVTVTPVPIRLVSCFPFNGNANDSKGLNNGTVYGATLTTDRFGNLNNAYDFDGNDDYIQTTFNNLENQNYTFSTWFNLSSMPNNNRFYFFSLGTIATEAEQSLYFDGAKFTYTSRYQPFDSQNLNLQINTWYHITIIREGLNIKFYLNGNSLSNLTASNYVTYFGNSTFYLGTYFNFTSSLYRNFHGIIDDFQINKGALTAGQVSYIYNSNIDCSDPTTLPFLTLNPILNSSICQNQTLSVPFSSVNMSPTAGSPINVELSDINGSFASPIIVGTSTLTSGIISATFPAGTVAGSGYKIRLKQGSIISNLSQALTISYPSTATISGTSTINEGQSTNLTINFTGSAPWTYAINNGTSQTTNSNPLIIPVSPLVNTTYAVTILSNLCGAGTSSGSAVVTVTPVPIRLVSCFPFNGNANDSKWVNNGTIISASPTTDRFSVANNAISFDGSSNYFVSIPQNQIMNNEFAYSFWINLNTINNVAHIFNTSDFIGVSSSFAIYVNDYDKYLRIISNNSNFTVASPFPLNSWIHVTVTQSSNKLNVYFNGVKVLDQTNVFTANLNHQKTTIGGLQTSPSSAYGTLSGKLDDFQIYKGALTEAQVTHIYNSLLNCNDPTTLPFLTLNTLSNNSICQNQTFSVPFSSVNISPTAGSPINVELSDINGSFASPIVVGSSTLTTGNISVTFPMSIVTGTGYKIRLKQGSIVGNLSQALTISYPSTVTISGTATINEGQSTNLTLNFIGTAPWTYAINNGASQTSNINPLIISVSPLVSTAYTVTSLSNVCGNSGVIAGTANVTITPVPIRLVSCFPFNGNANDSKGVNNGTVSGAVLTSDRFGVMNKAYYFDGNSHGISLTTNNFLNPEFTYSFWINMNLVNPLSHIFNISSDNGSLLPMVAINQDRKVLFTNHFTNNNILVSNTSINLNNWYNIVVIKSATHFQLYLNGVFMQEIPNTFSLYPSITYANIGSLNVGNNYGAFNGKIDDVQIYKGSLTASQVLSIYQSNSDCIDAVNPCLTNSIFTSMLAGQQTLQVNNQITGRSSIQTGANIHFDSKNSVVLEPGFVTQPNTIFKATVGGGCN